MDSEYEEFIEKYGHLDFSLLNFLPRIKTKEELILDHQKRQKDKRLGRSNEFASMNNRDAESSKSDPATRPGRFQRPPLRGARDILNKG